jgi:hypothetical protein
LDPAVVERRVDARFALPPRAEARATLRPGCAITLVDVSAGGALVEAPRPLRPGARVHVQILTTSRRFAIAAHVLRCAVWALDPLAGVTYRGAVKFEHRVEWCWAELTRRVQPMPEHERPIAGPGGNQLPQNRATHPLAAGDERNVG